MNEMCWLRGEFALILYKEKYTLKIGEKEAS